MLGTFAFMRFLFDKKCFSGLINGEKNPDMMNKRLMLLMGKKVSVVWEKSGLRPGLKITVKDDWSKQFVLKKVYPVRNLSNQCFFKSLMSSLQ